MKAKTVLAIVLAGGEGKRLMPLTKERAKPAVPFGGTYRLVDFPLSNLVNSGYRKIITLTQYKSQSLDVHISATWLMSSMLGDYVAVVPAQQRKGKHWYLGSADAIYQSLDIISQANPDYIVIVGSDHVYRMDFEQMVDFHVESGADLTVSAIRQPITIADQMGVVEIDHENPNKIKCFLEKPKHPKGLPDAPNEVLASMGNYVVSAKPFYEALKLDANNAKSKHDMGRDMVPYFVSKNSAAVYDFRNNDVPGQSDRDKDYWRDVGSISQFYESNIDLVQFDPIFNLYNFEWPLFSGHRGLPPAKFVHKEAKREGRALNSIVSPGAILSGASAVGSILSPRIKANSWSEIEDSIIFDDVYISRKCKIRRAIIDKNCFLGENVQIGFDKEKDLSRGLIVTDDGITVVPKGFTIKE